jgi:NAD(P) transhydrogenase
MLKIIAAPDGKKILGVMIVGENATEVIHVGQMAMLCEADVDIFVESTFNFPTLAEAYRIAALAILAKRPN